MKRNRSVSVQFDAVVQKAGRGSGLEVQTLVWSWLPTPLSELIQHEVDHLDGVLAIDRAEGVEGVACIKGLETGVVDRQEWLEKQEELQKYVDYVIIPTV